VTNPIFTEYWAQVRRELQLCPAERCSLTKSDAIHLSKSSLESFDAVRSIQNLSDSLHCNDWQKNRGTNWRWNTDPKHSTHSAEVKLERLIVETGESEWARQMATSSGIQGSTQNRRRSIDLVRRLGDRRYAFIELKVKSDNPLHAAFELLSYGLAYLHARRNNWQGEPGKYDVMKADTIELIVLAPTNFFTYKPGRGQASIPLSLGWLIDELNKGLVKLASGTTQMRLSFREFLYDANALDGLERAATEILNSTWN